MDTDYDPHRLEGSSGSVTLDVVAQTLTFEHFGSVASDEQKALSPVVLPLGAIAAVEFTPGRSTNWFWVQPRGQKPWKKGVWCDPHGVVCDRNLRTSVPGIFAAGDVAEARHPLYDGRVRVRVSGRMRGAKRRKSVKLRATANVASGRWLSLIHI